YLILELDHLADGFAGVEAVEAFVDFVQRYAMGHELFDWEAAAAMEAEEARDVARRHARSKVAAAQRALFTDERERGNVEYRLRVRQTCRDGSAATAGHGEGAFQRTG